MASSLILLLNVFSATAQKDSIQKSALKNLTPVHSPRKATILSAILPGAGQYYNHKYWKIPVIYAGGISLGYFLGYELANVNYADRNYRLRLNNDFTHMDPYYRIHGFTAADILNDKNYYLHYRDLAFIGCALLYTLNILDASVDAHLWHFDQKINDDLSFHISPSALPVYGSLYPAPGVRIAFCHK
ncbi:MAG: DUF5683 domain-containing protein [Bacteroidia bacterium]